jgi:hypothetical protein
MRTTRGIGPTLATATIFTGAGMTTTSHEIDYRMWRLAAEADEERLAGPRDGVRQHVGHALMALGRAIHGIEAEPAPRPALDAG